MYVVIINCKEGFFTSEHLTRESAKNKADYHKSIGHDVRGVFPSEFWEVNYSVGKDNYTHKVLFPQLQDNNTLDSIAKIAARKLGISEPFTFSY